MSIQVKWDNDLHTIILMTFMGKWNWHELREAVVESCELINCVSHKVHMIFDRGRATWTPGDYAAEMACVLKLFHPNTGYRVVVMNNPLTERMFFTYSASVGGVDFRFRYVKTVDKARNFLDKL